MNEICFRQARSEDVPLVMRFIMAHAEYERMSDEVFADERTLEEWIFDKGMAEVIFAQADGTEAGFVLFFHSFSTFLCRAGIHLARRKSAGRLNDIQTCG